jgi:L-ribulose-5-phosphate 3-epimerase
MFKKGIITDEISQELDTAIELSLKYNMDGIELRSVWEKGVHELSKEEINKIKQMVDAASLEVCALSSPFFKCDIDSEDDYIEHIKILKKSIEAAHILNINMIRGFTFWEKGELTDCIDKITEKFIEPVKIAEKEGITLVLESEPSVNAGNARKLRKVIEKINSPYVQALWDPGNDIPDPDCEIPYPDGYNLIKQYMVHMHLKDIKKNPDGTRERVPVGEGSVDFKGQFRALSEDKYKGYVVLETHYRPKVILEENLVKMPKGSAFSFMGYEATEDCLIKWNKLMEDV